MGRKEGKILGNKVCAFHEQNLAFHEQNLTFHEQSLTFHEQNLSQKTFLTPKMAKTRMSTLAKPVKISPKTSIWWSLKNNLRRYLTLA